MWWSKKEVRGKDRLQFLEETIESIYKCNPYAGEITLGLYREEIYRIQQSLCITRLGYDNFHNLLNGAINHFYYKGIKIYMAESKNRVDRIIVKNKVLNITNLKEFEKGK